VTSWIMAGALVVVAALAVAELGSRWWLRHRSRYRVWPAHARMEILMDPDVSPELEPRCRFYVNGDGERGAEVRAGEPGLYRILVAGGSAVECFGLDQPSSWPGSLERLLNSPDALAALRARRVHVGNIGHAGVGSAELDLIFARVLPQYGHLDAILIMVAASDVYHWIEEGARPAHPPSVVPESLLFGEYPRQPFGWKPGMWALAEIARRVRRRWFHPREVKERAAAWFRAALRMRAEATDVRTTMPDAAVVVSNFEDHFRRLLRRARSKADRVLVVRQPWLEGTYSAEEQAHMWQGGVGRPWKDRVTLYYSLDVVNRLLELVDSRVARVADALGVQHLDLRSLLTGRLRHYYDHDHHTPAGAAVIARAVAAALLATTSGGPRTGDRTVAANAL